MSSSCLKSLVGLCLFVPITECRPKKLKRCHNQHDVGHDYNPAYNPDYQEDDKAEVNSTNDLSEDGENDEAGETDDYKTAIDIPKDNEDAADQDSDLVEYGGSSLFYPSEEVMINYIFKDYHLKIIGCITGFEFHLIFGIIGCCSYG